MVHQQAAIVAIELRDHRDTSESIALSQQLFLSILDWFLANDGGAVAQSLVARIEQRLKTGGP
jgi:hypothetical protein